jgi:hypothetical protein
VTRPPSPAPFRRSRRSRRDLGYGVAAAVACVLVVAALGVARQSVAGVGAPLQQARTDAPARPGPSGAAREIKWDELVPKDWDPMKGFQGGGLGALDDADPRAADMLQRMRAAWDAAPTVKSLDGQTVKLPGYVVPLDEVKGELREFLLVPYFGACIHTPPPPANQIVLVVPKGGAKFQTMDTVWVTGTLKAARGDSAMGASGYRLESAAVEKYVVPAR